MALIIMSSNLFSNQPTTVCHYGNASYIAIPQKITVNGNTIHGYGMSGENVYHVFLSNYKKPSPTDDYIELMDMENRKITYPVSCEVHDIISP